MNYPKVKTRPVHLFAKELRKDVYVYVDVYSSKLRDKDISFVFSADVEKRMFGRVSG